MNTRMLILATVVFHFTVVSVRAQGTVNFANASTTSGLPPGNRNVVWGATAYHHHPSLVAGENVSSNYAGLDLSSYRVQLYVGSGTDIFTFAPVAGTLSTFKQSTSTTAGSWFNKTGTIIPGLPGQSVNLAVVVWNSALSADPFSVSGMRFPWAASAPFQYTITANPTPAPTEFLMVNFAGVVIEWVPEPSNLALAGLGGFAALAIRRRRQLIP